MENLMLQSLNVVKSEDSSFPTAYYAFWKDKRFNYLDCNIGYAKLIGYNDPSQLIGKSDHEIFSSLNHQYLSGLTQGDNEVLAGQHYHETIVINRPGSTPLTLIMSKFPLIDSTGQAVGIYGICTNVANLSYGRLPDNTSAEIATHTSLHFLANLAKQVTGQSQDLQLPLEEYAKDICNYLENIIACMPCNVYWLDRNCVLLGGNDNLAKMFGLKSRAELVGLTYEQMTKLANWTEGQGDAFRRVEMEVMASGEARYNTAEPPIFIDGKAHYFISSKVPLRNRQGEIIGVVGISTDITELKEMQIALIETKEEAEAANRSKSEFLATISHELRIPLTGILGMADLLMDDNLSPAHRKQVSSIVTAGDHLLSLVNELLDLAKFEAGKLELQPAPMDLRKVVEEVATMLNPQARAKNIEIVVDYPRDVPHLLIGDQRAIRQIFINLTGNAIKFTEKGYITLRVECIEQKDVHGKLLLSVEDTGIGIPLEKINLVFDRFSQVDSSHGRRYRGAGLGLTISKAFTELMGGHIKVESEIGKGSCFSCTLPFELQANAKQTTVWDPYKSTVRVLIVDDTLRGEIMQKHLGSSLTQVVPGNQALYTLLAAQQRGEPFHLAILDYQLHTSDALSLAQNIRKEYRASSLLLLLLIPPTLSMQQREEAKEAGFFECFVKPIHPTELLIRLTAAWEKWAETLESEVENKIPQLAKHHKILLVEDDAIIQTVHSMMLKKAGYAVDIAENAEQTLNMYTGGYAIILLDVGLPGMTGIEVANEIRRREAGTNSHIPIIGLTGYGLEEDKQNCLKAGMDDVAIKPIKPNDLCNLIEKWLLPN